MYVVSICTNFICNFLKLVAFTAAAADCSAGIQAVIKDCDINLIL